VIDRGGVPGIAMLADFYHFARNGYAAVSVIDGFSPLIRHIQIADAPGRHEPGTGSIDFADLELQLPAQHNYAGGQDA